MCRQMVCVKPGYELRNGRCISDTPTPINTTVPSVAETTTTVKPRTTTPDDSEEDDEEPSGRLSTDNTTNNESVDTDNGTGNNYVTVASTSHKTITTTMDPGADHGPGRHYTTDCPRFNISRLHYHVYQNGSIYINEYHRLYEPNDYVEDSLDGSILICIPMPENNLSNYLYSRKFSLTLAYLTLAGLGVSITCLVFHLLAFLFVPSLRNLSGKNLASLCIALFAGYVTFIISQFENAVSKEACTSVGVVLYYSFLASFFWMNAIAFDVWRTLRLATSELRISSGQQWRKFVIYSAYSWFGPAIIVAVSIVVENSASVPPLFRPSFGLVTCWFGNRRALLIFFVAPVITIVVLNVLMFALSAHIILSTTQNSAIHRPASKARRNFRLYLRLALIMGLSWIFGIIAGQVDKEPLWYVFVIFNTLQGLFIFLSFTCTKKVRVYLRDKVFCPQKNYFTTAPGVRAGRKFELEGRDSGSGESQSSQTSQTSRLSLTKTTSALSKTSTDTLY